MSDDLVKRLRKGGSYEVDMVVMEEAACCIEELEQLFDLRWAADMRAIKAWQIAHPDQPKTWPDHADLGTWCLSRIEKLEAELYSCFHRIEELQAALRNIAEGDILRAVKIPFRDDGQSSKHDRCEHGQWFYEDCGCCIEDYARKALEGKDE